MENPESRRCVVNNSPLDGVRILEVGGLGPAPFGVMLLADLGAEVIRVDRIPGTGADPVQASQIGLLRNRRSISIDLKKQHGLGLLLQLLPTADVLVEAFRPGVAERLGFGPDVCRRDQPGLIYARMTGWGQTGPLSKTAGHDINYLALSGALHPIGPADRPPTQPLNYLADFGGGGTFLAVGILGALLQRQQTGQGQTIDVAMLDGTASLTAFLYGMLNTSTWSGIRGDQVNDGSRPFYGTYRTADGGFLAVGCLEEQFYSEFIERLGLDLAEWPQDNPERWPEQRRMLEEIFASRERAYFEDLFEGSDACVTPVLTPQEAPFHEHLAAREVFRVGPLGFEPAPAPRMSGHQPPQSGAPPEPGQDTESVLSEIGKSADDIAALRRDCVIA